jgi:hypothetical protein
MLVNYLFGIIAQRFGLSHLTTVVFAEIIVMLVLAFSIFKKYNQYAGKTVVE